MIEINEIQIARECIGIALRKGADAARVSLNKCVSDTVTLLNGEKLMVSRQYLNTIKERLGV